MSQLIRSRYITEEFDHAKTKKISEDLCKIDLLNVVLRSKSFEGKTDKTAEWYNTKYSVE